MNPTLNTCSIGTVLRAVLFIQCCAAVGVMFVASSTIDWILRLALVTGGTLPATLGWLLISCLGQRWMLHWSPPLQYGALLVLGMFCGLYGCALLAWFAPLPPPAWIASALAGGVLSALLVAWLVIRNREKMPADTTARLAELQARIRPHFLFNTLNSAIALVRAEPAKAESMLEDLGDLFRQALKDSGEPVSLGTEIYLAQRYLAIEQVRFGERLRVQWLLDESANSAKLPPLLLQPLVENAVRHGVERGMEGADITIFTQRRGSSVVIKIRNTVPETADRSTRGHGMALQNVRQRLALLHDVQGRFNYRQKDGVYTVRMEIPM
jgi:two-component system, LytTR family, sensor histidine kinase AlgZ